MLISILEFATRAFYAMDIKLTTKGWVQKNEVYVKCSFCYKNGMNIDAKTVCDDIDSICSWEEIVRYLRSLNGQYAVIVLRGSFSLLATDKTRIYPVFYRCTGDRLYVSDMPEHLLSVDSGIDSIAEQEYLCTGAPFAGKTLICDIFQVVPASAIVFTACRNYTVSLYSMLVSESYFCSDEYFYIHIYNVFERITTSLGNRQVVIPLSGGYDSRLVLCMLKRLKYENIICYTVGPDIPEEQRTAVNVAKTLGVPIYHIDYSDERFVMQRFGSADFVNMIDFVGSFGNFLWLFEYNAILWLESKGLLMKDAVFMPGHCGDFSAGSHIHKYAVSRNGCKTNLVYKFLLHAFEYGKPLRNGVVRAELKRIFNDKTNRKYFTYSVFQDFVFKNRIAHQITNSARIYEFMGYSVALPLLDDEITDFLKFSDYFQIRDKSLYDYTVRNHVFAPMGVDFDNQPAGEMKYFLQRIKNVVKPFVSRDFYLKRKGNSDNLGEKYLTVDMLAELVEDGILRNSDDYLSQNEIMLRWYLSHVRKML